MKSAAMKFLILIIFAILPGQIFTVTICANCTFTDEGMNPDTITDSALNCECWSQHYSWDRIQFSNSYGPNCTITGDCCVQSIGLEELKNLPANPCPENKFLQQKTSTSCECVCDNFGILQCALPWIYNNETCLCGCSLTCPRNQYLDVNECKCKCREPCRDCVSPQVWNERVCSCRCQYPVSCDSSRFFNPSTCRCDCIQYPRLCCSLNRSPKIWSPRSCDCVCAQTVTCAYEYVWDPYICRCVYWIER